MKFRNAQIKYSADGADGSGTITTQTEPEISENETQEQETKTEEYVKKKAILTSS